MRSKQTIYNYRNTIVTNTKAQIWQIQSLLERWPFTLALIHGRPPRALLGARIRGSAGLSWLPQPQVAREGTAYLFHLLLLHQRSHHDQWSLTMTMTMKLINWSTKLKGWFVPRELTLYNAFQDLFVCFLPEAPENDTDRDWFQGYRENKDELFWHRAHKLCHCVIATTQFVCTMARIDIWCGF